MKKTKYDLTLIIRGDKSLEEAQNIFDNIKTKLEKFGFEIEKTMNPVLKELSFEIKKFRQGYYGSFVFTADNFINSQIEEMFKFDENVLRFLTTVYSDVLVKFKVRENRKKLNVNGEKVEKVEEKTGEVKENEVEEKIEEKIEEKSIDLEHLDEKLDELLK